MSPEELVRCVDFRYITDALTPQEALEILRKNEPTRPQREQQMLQEGFPAYTTSAGWLGYPDEKVRRLSREAVEAGRGDGQIKVGVRGEEHIRRGAIAGEGDRPDRERTPVANHGRG